MSNRWKCEPMTDVSPDLPIPYVGYFELWVDAQADEQMVCLNLFFLAKTGITGFLRTFHGHDAMDAQTEFEDWLQAEYNTALMG